MLHIHFFLEQAGFPKGAAIKLKYVTSQASQS